MKTCMRLECGNDWVGNPRPGNQPPGNFTSGIPSKPRNHTGESSQNHHPKARIQNDQRSNSDQRTRIVTLLIHFLMYF